DYFRRAEAVPEAQRSAAVMQEFERNREIWNRHTREIRAYVREAIIAHNFAVLSNIVAVAMSIFVSVIVDATLLAREDDSLALRSLATSAFFYSAVPFTALMLRYLRALLGEEAWHYQTFGEPPDPGSGARP